MASPIGRLVLYLAMSVMLPSGVASAQATADLSGRVTDESGAVLPGVTVTATQTNTGFVRSVVTEGAGTWVMPNLPIGPYRLEVALQGFRTYVQTGIVLQVGATPTINAVMAVGALEETVAVEAAAPLVDVRSAGISEVVEQERILSLPLQGREVTNLIALAGAAVQTGEASTRSMRGGVSISIAGSQGFGVAYELDGAMHNDPQNNLNLPMPFPDALQEFRVSTSGLSASQGMHAGGSVSAVTKSGTNAFSGNVFTFLRDRRFNASQAFAPVGADGQKMDDGMSRQQYGGTLGGPIVRDRVFFFGGYQGTRLRQQSASITANVPTAAMLAGDFSAFASPTCQGREVTLSAPFVNNRVNPSLLSPAALNLAARLPSSTHPCGETTYQRPQDENGSQLVGRLDYQVTGNHSIFTRYLATSFDKPSAYGITGNPLTTPAPGVGLDNMAQSLAFGDTFVMGSNMVNSFRATFNRILVDRANVDYFDSDDLGVDAYNYSPIKEIIVNVTGGFNVGGSTAAVGEFNSNALQLDNELSLVRGNHQASLGANVAYWRLDFLTGGRAGGVYEFTGQLTGLGMSDLLLGRVARLEHGGLTVLPMDMLYLGLYAQDAWRVSRRVTLNVGLRWEPYFGQRVRGDTGIVQFSMDNFRNDVRSTVFHNAPAGLVYNGDPGYSGGRTGMDTQWWNLSPRVGVAWDVTGDGRTAVRSSYGMAYSFKAGETHNFSMQAVPFANGQQIEAPSGGFDAPYAHIGGDPHPLVTSPDTVYPPYSPFGALDPTINSPRTQSWNVTIEQQMGGVWQVAASYLGSYTDRLWLTETLNPGVFLGTAPCTLQGVSYPVCTTNANINARRVLTLSEENPEAARKIGFLDRYSDEFTQDYHGLKLSFQRRATTGFSLSGNYTRSHCFGDRTSAAWEQVGSGFTNPSNPAMDRGYCDQDRTHLANFTVGAQSPDFTNAALRALASDWRVSGILNARSGSRLSVTTGRDNAFNGQTGQRVDQVSDDVYGGTLTSYLDRAAFAQPANGTFGDYVRNSLEGPGYWSVDLALSRLVTVARRQSLEFRVEAFNLFNNFNWGNPVTNFGSGQFGRITSQTGDPRVLQFGLKYGF